jgi:hypothetical protein
MSFYSFYDIQNLREKIKNMKNYINNELSVLNKQRNDYISKNYNKKELVEDNPTLFIENEKLINNIKTLYEPLFNFDDLHNKDINEELFLNLSIELAKKIIIEFKALRKNQKCISQFFYEKNLGKEYEPFIHNQLTFICRKCFEQRLK